MDSHSLLSLLCILRNNCTKAAVPLLSKFSKQHSTRLIHASKLYKKRWHCIFKTIVKLKENAVTRNCDFHFLYICNFVAAFDTICSFQSSVKMFQRQSNKIYLPFL